MAAGLTRKPSGIAKEGVFRAGHPGHRGPPRVSVGQRGSAWVSVGQCVSEVLGFGFWNFFFTAAFFGDGGVFPVCSRVLPSLSERSSFRPRPSLLRSRWWRGAHRLSGGEIPSVTRHIVTGG